MRMLTFSGRTAKEILRDPLNLFFGLAFPVLLLLLLSAIQANVPVDIFSIGRLAPGIAVFSLSFITLFSAMLLSKDRGSSLLQRLYTTPLTAGDFILGYALPLLPISLVQSLVCYAAAVALGLPVSVELVWAVLLMAPVVLFFIGTGLLCGSLLNDKQVGGICGALLTQVAALLSGAWFDVSLVGGPFAAVANVLPYIHAVEMERAILQSDWQGIFPHLWWVLGYAAAAMAAAVWLFLRQMKRQ